MSYLLFSAPSQSDSDAGFGAESDSLLFWLSRLFLIADLSLSSVPPPPADRLYLFPIVPPPTDTLISITANPLLSISSSPQLIVFSSSSNSFTDNIGPE